MPIAFNEVPANLRVPGLYAEIDGTGAAADLTAQPYQILVLGQRLTTGTVAAGVPTRVTSIGAAHAFFGRGSMLANMAERLLQNNAYTEAWYVASDDPSGGAAAAGTITLTAASVGAGTLAVMVGGRRVSIAVAAAATSASLATLLADAITADLDMPVTAVVDGTDDTQVNLEARHTGTVGNGIDVRHSFYDDEFAPVGLTVDIVAMASGAGDVDIAAAIAATPDEQYHVVVMPYTTAALLSTLDTELEARFGPTRMIPGVAFAALNATHSATMMFGASQNRKLLSVMGTNGSPTPTYEWAAALAGVVAANAPQDPARPFQTLALKGILPPARQTRWTDPERNLLLYDGVATHRVDAGGSVLIERLITTYQENGLAADDIAFLDVNTLLTLDRLRYELRTRFSLKYPRAKLGDDGRRYGVGQVIVTPIVARGEVIALFEDWLERGLVEGAEQFAESLIVERNGTDPNRLDIELHPDLMNQLRVFGAKISFIL